MNRLDESLSWSSFKKYITGKVENNINISNIFVNTDGIIKEKRENNVKNI